MKVKRKGNVVIKKFLITVIFKDKEQIVEVGEYFGRLAAETGEEYEVSFYKSLQKCRSGKLKNCDLVLFGILEDSEMQEAENFRRENCDIRLVIISDSAKYALHGYSVDAKGYLTTPVDYSGFQSTVKRILRF